MNLYPTETLHSCDIKLYLESKNLPIQISLDLIFLVKFGTTKSEGKTEAITRGSIVSPFKWGLWITSRLPHGSCPFWKWGKYFISPIKPSSCTLSSLLKILSKLPLSPLSIRASKRLSSLSSIGLWYDSALMLSTGVLFVLSMRSSLYWKGE